MKHVILLTTFFTLTAHGQTPDFVDIEAASNFIDTHDPASYIFSNQELFEGSYRLIRQSYRKGGEQFPDERSLEFLISDDSLDVSLILPWLRQNILTKMSETYVKLEYCGYDSMYAGSNSGVKGGGSAILSFPECAELGSDDTLVLKSFHLNYSTPTRAGVIHATLVTETQPTYVSVRYMEYDAD